MIKYLLSLLIFIISLNTYSKVWPSNSTWNQDTSKEFSRWISSEEYSVDIFNNKSSPWYGIETDCADAIVAAQVIYAYEMKVKYTVKLNQSGTALISSDTKIFDHIQDPLNRVKSFIHHIGKTIGTEALARYNSYPIDLKEMRPGDFYISRWMTNGSFIRHAAMIKSILPTGHLVLYSSTTPVKVRELEVREGMPLHIMSGTPWGFKRVQPYIEPNTSQLENYSLNQYKLLRSAGNDSFFPRVVDILKTEEDTLEGNLLRRVKNLCSQLELRQREVISTQKYLELINNRCMNYSEYDEHSTPSRDKSLLNGIKRLLYGWKKIRKSSHSDELSTKLTTGLDSLLRKNDEPAARENLKSLCSIELEIDSNIVSYDLKNFFDLSLKGKISSHPNDSIPKRWGAPGQNTQCKSFY